MYPMLTFFSLSRVDTPAQPPPSYIDGQLSKHKDLEREFRGKWFDRAGVLKTHLDFQTGAMDGSEAIFSVLRNMYRHVSSHGQLA